MKTGLSSRPIRKRTNPAVARPRRHFVQYPTELLENHRPRFVLTEPWWFMSNIYPALDWTDLGPPVQVHLRAKGFDAAWFAGKGKDEDFRRTVLNLYVKMARTSMGGRRLWDSREYIASMQLHLKHFSGWGRTILNK